MSQVLASCRNSCDGHYKQNWSHNDAMMTSGYTGWMCDVMIRVKVTMKGNTWHQGSATDMHQLAVVGGVRNVNGVPGVFGPADGRGQCCTAFLFWFIQQFLCCIFCLCFNGLNIVFLDKKGSPVLYQLAPWKALPLFWWPFRQKCQTWSSIQSTKAKHDSA